MNHIVYVDKKSSELESLISGKVMMIVRGATGRKLPYGRVSVDDTLYFINNNGEGEVKAKTEVISVLNSEKLTKDESINLIEKNQEKLNLTKKQFDRWAGKRYLVLIEIKKTVPIKPFLIDRSNYGNMDDWLPVEDLSLVKKTS